MNRHPREYTARAASILLFFILITTLVAFAGCRPVQQPEPGPGIQEPQPPAFAWDTTRRSPRWRDSSPIQWHRTADQSGVLTESRSSGKPILCYVSRYDSDLTATIEDGLFPSDLWGERIAANFVAWEIDWWENPELAQSLLGSATPPALFVLMPSADNSTDEFGVIDSWIGRNLLSFPLHEGILPLDDPAADERIAELSGIGWDNVQAVELERFDVDPDEFASERLDELTRKLFEGEGLYPDEVLYAVIELSDTELLMMHLVNRANAWGPYIEEIDENLIWMPDDAFVPGAGWAIDPVSNLEAIACSIAVGSDRPIAMNDLLTALRSTLVLESGAPGGGIPAYLDIRSSFQEGSGYLDDEASLSLEARIRLQSPVTGPRDITWVNARSLAWLYRLVNMDSTISDIEITEGLTFGDYIASMSAVVILELFGRAGDVSSMAFHDRVYMLDLLNQAYQRTADISLLEKAGEIADTFPAENPDEWFDARMFPMLPDLAIALHHYGWLAENEDSRDVADFITEEAATYAPAFPDIDQNRLAYAHDVVHSMCVHVAILSRPDDDRGWELLRASLLGWNPRLVSQLLEPERDKDLIEVKGYTDLGEASAFVCTDNICFIPTSEVEELAETLGTAMEVLEEEEGEGEE